MSVPVLCQTSHICTCVHAQILSHPLRVLKTISTYSNRDTSAHILVSEYHSLLKGIRKMLPAVVKET